MSCQRRRGPPIRIHGLRLEDAVAPRPRRTNALISLSTGLGQRESGPPRFAHAWPGHGYRRVLASVSRRNPMRIGYFLSTEEYAPDQLVEQARAAERAGFEGLWISDHFHPWNNDQGNSPFVWSVIGAISQVCELHVTTAVTCPMIRTHPVIIAQAAATSAQMLGGKFTLGVGSGEALNEHILGTVWPSADVRL